MFKFFKNLFSSKYGKFDHTKIYIAGECLPMYNRDVIIYSTDCNEEIQFEGYLTCKGEHICWKGTVGLMKDKYRYILSSDNWTYKYW